MNSIDLTTSRFVFPRMHPEGRRFVLLAFLLMLLAALLWWPLSFPGACLVYGVYLFFRDPERVTPSVSGVVVSPADGIVSIVDKVPVPAILGAGDAPVWRVCVFMSVLDVHVNRMPAAGTVVKSCYIPGKFFNASLDKASEHNERHLYLMQTARGERLAFVQIAGLIARRIVSFVKEGQELACGERFGLIRFGSRVDVYLPPGIEPAVLPGQIMVAGETILAKV
ncbi:MAG: phosphatidylserine decarboxylase [Kiritimatiellae bacterium]|nr:phosphatidylserine decarboxylase [Kiritimatiellia bacterium]